MMFGGTRRNLTDGTNLRGDINVLLLGDPSVAKSQFLKFASQVAPIAIYTSGKGSSAAGLTASVVRSQTTGDFHLEAGALVLADGGMVCIDEFDKMREQDRVAIHEAMEQQTISIAKAGITTVLNSRCAVLAAANPVFGRYDDMKSATENIDFQATILSRFDLIFILRDRSEDALDEALSTHIINTHKHKDEMNSTSAGMIDNFVNGVSNEASAQQQQQQQQQHQPQQQHQQQHQQDDNNGDDIIPPDVLKDLIAFSRTIHPCLTEAARLKIENEYVNLRQEMARTKRENPSAQVIPITVRQLEAMIRIAEAIARMSLTEEANEYHVQLAIDLFRSATGEAAGSSQQLGSGANLPAELGQLQQQCENFILNRLSPGQSIPTRALKNELVAQQFSLAIIDRVLVRLVDRKALAYQKQSKIIFRPNV
jgi:DNA replication licensing factor MCM5